MPDDAPTLFRFRLPSDEDLPRLARLAFDVSQAHCAGCRDYHVMWPYLRAFGANGGGPEAAWDEQVAVLARTIAGRPVVRWLLAGSADSGQLALVLAAIAEVLPARHEITIVDRCETPLALCRAHAESAGVAIETVSGDLWTFDRAGAFDIVLLHYLLLFVPVADHAPLVARIAGNLAPRGRLVLVAATRSGSAGTAAQASFRSWRESIIREEAAAGRITIPENLDTFLARLDGMRAGRRPETYDETHNVALLAAAGLDLIEEVALPTDDPRIADPSSRAFRARHILVAERRA